MITRNQALEILAELGNSPNMVKHALACEAAMRTLYKRLTKDIKATNETEEDWAIVGLLHDADYEATGKSEEQHTEVVTQKLKTAGSRQEIIDAIRGHANKSQRNTMMAKAIYAVDELTGLIVATALVMPDKKLLQVTADSVLKKFKEPRFAAGANREQIKTCEAELQIPLSDFVGVVLKSMQRISNELGL